MSNASNSSKPGSDTTLAAGRKPFDVTSEAAYVAQQAADAKVAMAGAARELKSAVEQSIHAHPLLAIGLAAVTGALIARAVAPHPRHGHNGDSEAAPPPSEPSFIDTILTDTLRPLALDLAGVALGMFTKPPAPAEPPRGTPDQS